GDPFPCLRIDAFRGALRLHPGLPEFVNRPARPFEESENGPFPRGAMAAQEGEPPVAEAAAEDLPAAGVDPGEIRPETGDHRPETGIGREPAGQTTMFIVKCRRLPEAQQPGGIRRGPEHPGEGLARDAVARRGLVELAAEGRMLEREGRE